jgi:TolB protein
MKTLILSVLFGTALTAAGVGIFDSDGSVGDTPKKGSVEYNAAAGEYRITGGGANIWASTDAFHFVWKRLSGDVTLTADVQFSGAGAAAHRKAVLMVRQGLEPDSPYADVALHGDGLTSLQFRPTTGAITQEIRSPVTAPTRIRIERRGEQFTIYAGKPGEELKATGTAIVSLKDPVYVGLGVCSHNADNLETVVFSNVKLEQ